MSKITALIADDHPLVIALLKQLLEKEGIEVIGCASHGEEAWRMIVEKRPNLAILDLRMPSLGGLEVARRVESLDFKVDIIIYTGFPEVAVLTEALDAGVKGFVAKSGPIEELVRAIQSVCDGRTYIDPVLAGSLMTNSTAHPNLSKREREVLRFLAEGLTNEAIGKKLFLSPETIRTHIRNATVKLSAKNRVEAVAIGFRDGIIS